MDIDLQVRTETFRWLAELRARHGDVLPRDLLVAGFDFRGQRIPLMSPQGIFKPRILDYPLTITTVPDGPYDDSATEDGILYYKYRGTDPHHRDNVGLRRLLAMRRPLVYFYGLVPGQYLALWPVFITHDNPAALTFTVQVDDLDALDAGPLDQPAVAEAAEGRRAYVTSIVRRRLHQHSFRERVLHAYQEQCAFCRLRHRELLDAAHIVPDAAAGQPIVANGLSLCKLHHTAFDRYLLGVTPDYEIRVPQEILAEEDGPMLHHGLKALHGQRLIVPHARNNRPDRDGLAWRFERYRAVHDG